MEWSTDAQSANGNTQTNYDNALLNYGSNFGGGHPQRTDCQEGYQKAYQRLAMYVMQPYATAIDGASRFFQNLCQTSEVDFGLMGFSVTPAVTTNYNCSYIYNDTGGNLWSLALGTPANTYKPANNPYSAYVYAPPQIYGGSASFTGPLINPNFWVTVPAASTSQGQIAPGGPAGGSTAGAGEAYHSSLNKKGPTRKTWLYVATNNNNLPPSNDNSMWAFNNPGFQIPRAGCDSGATQQDAMNGTAGDDWSGFDIADDPGTGTGNPGGNGLFHALPLYDTAGLEALEVALYNLTDTGALNTLTNRNTGLGDLTNYGTKKAIVFFTDGVPTDDSTPYSLYKSGVITPAKNNGVSIYAIGLALNSSVKSEQYLFLSNLANKGACGSQEFQVTSASSLTSTFTGIARQLAQCQR